MTNVERDHKIKKNDNTTKYDNFSKIFLSQNINKTNRNKIENNYYYSKFKQRHQNFNTGKTYDFYSDNKSLIILDIKKNDSNPQNIFL